MNELPDQHEAPAEEAGYEKKDINVRKTLLFGSLIVLVIAIILVILNDVFVLQKEEMMYDLFLKPKSITLRDVEAQETEILTTYKVLDAQKGVYRIPISRAMELMADEAYRAPQEETKK